ncbi:MAG: Bro-N domain-containing protein [Oscillospiraceae bacterium]|jgi:prophage antirepressor-like protein|nr:Bro-N domain-containing protein [Oscillospiraceae bacterium]
MKLVKSDHFGEVAVDVYQDGNEFLMTRNQIGEGLGYSDPVRAIKDIHARHKDRLDQSQFSRVAQIALPSGGKQKCTVYTRKGVMEICRWSQQPNANAFMDWCWELIDSLMRGEAKVVSMTEYQQMMAATRTENIRIQKARLLERLAGQYEGEYRQVLHAYAAKELTGEMVLPLPDAPQEHEYTAEQMGEIIGGISGQMVGRIANQHGLKVEQYGRFCVDKARHSQKEVKSFRYNDAAIPAFKQILGIA